MQPVRQTVSSGYTYRQCERFRAVVAVMHQTDTQIRYHVPSVQNLMIFSESIRNVIHDIAMNVLVGARLHVTVDKFQSLKGHSDTHRRCDPFSGRDIQQRFGAVKEVTVSNWTAHECRNTTLDGEKPVCFPTAVGINVIEIGYRHRNDFLLIQIRLLIVCDGSCHSLPCEGSSREK